MKTLKFAIAAAIAVCLSAVSLAQAAASASKSVNKALGSQDFNSLQTGAFTPSLANGFAYSGSDNESEIVEISENDNALKVSVGTEPLLGMLKPGASAAEPVTIADLTIDQKVYINSKIQFTVTRASEEVSTDPGDKLKIWLQETVDETTGDTTTNLFVRALEYKYDGGQFVSTVRTVKTTRADIRPGTWYNLRI